MGGRSTVRRLAAAILAMATGLTLGGCAAQEERKATTRPLITILVHDVSGTDGDAGTDGSGTTGTGSSSSSSSLARTKKAWKALAAAYTKQKGVRVSVTVVSSLSYGSALRSAMAASVPPTLFVVDGPAGAHRWRDYLADLGRSRVYTDLRSRQLALRDGSTVVAVPAGAESYGIAYRADILKKYFALVAKDQSASDASASGKSSGSGDASSDTDGSAQSSPSSGTSSSGTSSSGASGSSSSAQKPVTALSQVTSAQALARLLDGVQGKRADLGLDQAVASGVIADGRTGTNGGWGTDELADFVLGCALGTTDSTATVRSLDGIDPHQKTGTSAQNGGSGNSDSSSNSGQSGSGNNSGQNSQNSQNGSDSQNGRSTTQTARQIKADRCVNGLRDMAEVFTRDGGNPDQSSADALAAFAGGKAAFLPVSTSAWNRLNNSGLKASQIGFLPVRFRQGAATQTLSSASSASSASSGSASDATASEQSGFISGAETYWAVNSQASRVDQTATTAFLDWIATSQAGRTFAQTLGLWLPYSGAADTSSGSPSSASKSPSSRKTAGSSGATGGNPLRQAVEKRWQQASAARQTNPDLMFKHQLAPTTQWSSTVASALKGYAGSPSDATWKNVSDAFLQNWRDQYLTTEQ